MDEKRLIKKIRRNGDRAAADELIRHYYPEIYGFVRKQLRDADSALDLTQEIFISVLKTIPHFDPDGPASFRTWLYRVASNKVVDLYRSRSWRTISNTLPLETQGDVPDSESDFIEMLADAELFEKVMLRLAGLPAQTQGIFRLHVFGECTFSEIADMLKMPQASVKSRYYRLIGQLRKEFSDYG